MGWVGSEYNGRFFFPPHTHRQTERGGGVKVVLTDELSRPAVDVEGVVALLMVGVTGLEQESVGTELGLRDVVDALVVQVALLRIGEEPVAFRTLEIWKEDNRFRLTKS